MELDIKEKYELLREVAEHNALFMNPEGVQQVRDARENSYETPEEEFNQMVKDMFGKELPREYAHGEPDVLRQDRCSSVIDMDLDEVKFTPF